MMNYQIFQMKKIYQNTQDQEVDAENKEVDADPDQHIIKSISTLGSTGNG